jgi:cytochrome c biogenesis protein CcmG/thiol:disulfide interchange protein DsbE
LPSTIEQMQQERKEQRFTILLIDIREDPDRVAAWVKAKSLTPTVLLDKDAAVTRAYRVTATPTVVVIGRDGKMVARGSGARSWNTGAARQLLDALVGTPVG